MIGREFLGVEGLGLETKGAIRKTSVAEVVVFVDRTRVDKVLEAHLREDIAELGVEHDVQFVPARRNHALEHRGVAILWDSLEIFAQVTVVAVGADRDASADRSIEIFGVTLPLLQRVAFEKLFIELPSDLADDDLFGVGRILDVNAVLCDPSLHFFRGRGTSKKLLEGVKVDGEVPVTAVGVGEDLVVDRVPLSELTQVVNNARSVGAEVMRSVGVDEDAGFVVFVVSVPAEVISLLNDETRLPLLCGETLGNRQAGKAGTDNDAVKTACWSTHSG